MRQLKKNVDMSVNTKHNYLIVDHDVDIDGSTPVFQYTQRKLQSFNAKFQASNYC